MGTKKQSDKLTGHVENISLSGASFSTLEERIQSSLRYLKSLESDHPGKYWEVHPHHIGTERADGKHGDFKIWPQSQYLLYVTFKRFEMMDSARKIFEANDFNGPAIDRRGLLANSRFCVLDNDVPPFYLREWPDSSNYDEKALIGLHWAIIGNHEKAKKLALELKDKWHPEHKVLDMDEGDKLLKKYPLYKTALAGTLFAKEGMMEEWGAAEKTLGELQERNGPDKGGWKTDLDSNGQKDINSVANVETTCLAMICLDSANKGEM